MQFVGNALRAKNRYQLRLATILLGRIPTTCIATCPGQRWQCFAAISGAVCTCIPLQLQCGTYLRRSHHPTALTRRHVAYSWAKRRPGNLCCCQCGRADFMRPDHVSSARLGSCSVWFLWLLLWPKNKTTKRRQATAPKGTQINNTLSKLIIWCNI